MTIGVRFVRSHDDKEKLDAFWFSYESNNKESVIHLLKKTKIIATIGSASWSVETLKSLMLSGMDMARINFSHGDYTRHGETIDAVKKAREELACLLR